MTLSFTVKIKQTLPFQVERDATINESVKVKQNIDVITAIDRNLFYTVCLEIQ